MRRYLLDVVAGEELHQLLLEPLQGRAQGEEQVIQVPRDGLLEAGLPEGIACSERARVSWHRGGKQRPPGLRP